jgi:hypothetical protein
MSIVKYDTLQIQLSEFCQPVVTVPSWETPVLQALHTDSVIVKNHFVVERKLPEAGDEFTRLALRYGPKNDPTPYVAAVYGNFGPGVSALKRAIEGAVTTRRKVATEARKHATEVAASAQAEAEKREAEADNGAATDAEKLGLNNADASVLGSLGPDVSVSKDVQELVG